VRVFLDTNILLDIVERRVPFFAASEQVLDRCDISGFDLFVAGHGLATLYYVTKRKAGAATALAAIHQILGFAEVAPLGDAEARRALGYGIADYEDGLQAAAAAACAADWLITRDATGFAGCPVPILSPEEFLQSFPPPAQYPEGEKR
jgi:predicted nucleic acid-binding protein